MTNRIKLQKKGAPLDPRIVALVNELTKDYREEIDELKKRVEELETRADNQLVHINNHAVVFADLHTSFTSLSGRVGNTSTKRALEEFAEMGLRSLSDHETNQYYEEDE